MKQITKECPVCGVSFQTTTAKKAPKTCGSIICSKTRKLSTTSKDKIANKLIRDGAVKRDGKVFIFCARCGEETQVITTKAKVCVKCRHNAKVCPKCGGEVLSGFGLCGGCHKVVSSLGGRVSIAGQFTRSKMEGVLAGFLSEFGPVLNDKGLLGGFEVDILFPGRLAVEYRGPWHYRPIMGVDSLGCTRNRDFLKERMLGELGVPLWVVQWALSNHERVDRLRLESRFIGYALDGSVNPFRFVYDRGLFRKQFECLRRSVNLGACLHCRDVVEWYFKHIWGLRVGGELCALDFWDLYKDKVVENRLRYSDLKPRSLRRFFKLFDLVPSVFQDSFAKRMALMIDGGVVGDPFAGFGGRFLGVCAAGKRYLGFDSNIETVNGNVVMGLDLGLDGSCVFADSGCIEPVVCDGVISSPPFFNKDDYGGGGYSSLDDYIGKMRKCFGNFIIKDKAIIDFKGVSGCSVMDFRRAIPWRVVEELDVDFGGMGRRSVHTWFVCKNW